MFLRYTIFPLQRMNDNVGEILTVLKLKGWRSQPVLWSEEQDGVRDRWLGRSPVHRRIGDSLSWIIGFPEEGINCSPVPASVIEYFGFEITRKSADTARQVNPNQTLPHYRLSVFEVQSTVLR